MASTGFKYFTFLATILALFSNIFIYTFPSFHVNKCSWKCSNSNEEEIVNELSLSDKIKYKISQYYDDVHRQIFSDNNSTNKHDPYSVRMLAFGDPQIKGIWRKTSYLGMLDVYANDHYLGHIYSTMKERLNPTHVAILGDLFSSQWISDSEFYNRTHRYLERLYKRDTTWLTSIKEQSHDDDNQYKVDWHAWGDDYNAKKDSSPMAFEYGYSNVYSWDPENEELLFLNLTGNHDVGYSGDVTYQHMARYSELFGKDNFWIEYDVGTNHSWRIVVLNSLLLEGPSLQPEFIETNWNFLDALKNRNFTGSTVLLTHVPFYKMDGLCYDGPLFRYYPENYEREPYKAHLLRSQNHLSEEVTNKVLNMIFDNSKPGIILTGHDHEGCETIYNKLEQSNTWNCTSTITNPNHYIKEVTVRSVMGDFSGNTGVVTGTFDQKTGNWQWNFTLCPFAVQHVWWFAKVTLILSVISWPICILF